MPTQPDQIFPLRCPKCSHVTYFDKAVVCAKQGRTYRGTQRDELLLDCESCGHAMTHEVDCEGYR